MVKGYDPIEPDEVFAHLMENFKVVAHIENHDYGFMPGDYVVEDLTVNTVLALIEADNVTFFAKQKETDNIWKVIKGGLKNEI